MTEAVLPDMTIARAARLEVRGVSFVDGRVTAAPTGADNCPPGADA